MTSYNESLGTRTGTGFAAFALPVFASALFLSAFLIFAVQPMFAKMVLPLLGGAPAVWNTAMVFFQASLLAGYLYAHLLAKKVPSGLQPILHLAVMAGGASFLPFAVNLGFLPQPDAPLAPAVIVLFAVSIGFPFFALSANAPLLQAWFARSGHKDSEDPYFLYGASNVGSVLALLAYPVIIEPFLATKMQAFAWAMGYGLLAIVIAGAAVIGLRMRPAPGSFFIPYAKATPGAAEERPTSAPIAWAMRGRWMLAAAIPSSLMLGVTTNITTNVAAAPFLWVLPLALYLGTFILVFDRRGSLPMHWIGYLHTALLVAVLLFSFLFNGVIAISVGLHLALFFVSALICHADLASRRPPADRLTEFYLCMSAGGVIGGGLTALFAPELFPTIFEYPLMLAAACLFLPGAIGRLHAIAGDIGFGLGTLGLTVLITFAAVTFGGDIDGKLPYTQALFIALPLLYCLARHRPVRAAATALAMAIAVQFLVPQLSTVMDTRVVSRERSFFGVSTVKAIETEAGLVHRYAHGDTIHNTQLRAPGETRVPLAYYSHEGPFGDIVRAAREKNPAMSVAAIGLGAGALACHTGVGEDWVFYEIDPAVIRMATDPDRFSYMSECAPDAPIVLGDARLTMAEEADGRFDLVIVDAFASDSIPAHLVTVEAIEMYRSKMKPDGLLFFHVSNRFVDVASVAGAAADALGLGARHIFFLPDDAAQHASLKTAVTAVAIAPEPLLAAALDGVSDWSRKSPNAAVSAWTDDWSNIVGALIAKARGGPQPAPETRLAGTAK